MKSRIRLNSSIWTSIFAITLLLILNSTVGVLNAQSLQEPKRDVLLNGLRVLIVKQTSNPNVTIALRIQSGAVFDLAGKSGTMALLGDQLFPDTETRDFFVDELGGKLEVTVDYDAVNIVMTGRATEYERMLEILRTGLISTPITVETVSRLRTARIKMSREIGNAPFSIAERAIEDRLFGTYPYGRPVGGTPESLARIDRADLILARERFHSPDNSTLLIVGGVQEPRALKALRQLLGAWRKSDKIVPATFRMPDAPAPATLIVDVPGADSVEIRLATRSLSRSDNDYAIANLISALLRDRWKTALLELNTSAFFIRNNSHLLSGMFVMGATVRPPDAARVLESGRATLRSLVETPPSTVELERVRNEMKEQISKTSGDPNSIAQALLDIEAYKLSSSSDQMQNLSKITTADVQRVAARIFRDALFASVVVGNASLVKADLERSGKVEVMGAQSNSKSPEVVAPARTP
jgi:zinc protease